ncbi:MULTISPECIES: aggregation factor core [unclassified Ruegeria]|uniref:aggregation factor core n=1 Tax=unclassified Ruegeria TaxID=2625375 RepID=UPI001487DD4F|nr:MULTISPECIES: aggregation factor core [unclassified Ruegeria]NOD48114.1 aggregation factor core [Ruegeria sp. HKCCD5849]NOD53475.1 aggregation factor core [Ruegeria sp. HKCCD5851]NOD70047.1 aggregation factor core [Ruegeria sp. HKCCD7303]NOE35915.1 aggregation factor core [Ruegeria sp. HKCCD7318]
MLPKSILAATFGLFAATSLQAGVQIRFIEGAPKDRFVLTNVGACEVEASTVKIDLSQSAGRLIFDVTEKGAGVEVFQPLEFVEGADALRQIPAVVDGQDAIELEIASLAAGDKLSFTIDVDDTIGQREITVTGSEIEGATVSFTDEGETSTAIFSSEAFVKVTTKDC